MQQDRRWRLFVWRHRQVSLALAFPILVAALIAPPFIMISSLLLARAPGLPDVLQLSLVPRSATAGIASEPPKKIHASAPLTAALVILTGIVGAIAVTPLMNAVRINNYAVRGFAVGARAFQVDPIAGTFAGQRVRWPDFVCSRTTTS